MNNTACKGRVISFNCTADAHPAVTSYQLFENEIAIFNTSATGMWSKSLEKEGEFVYKCVANNSVGSEYSMSVTVTVNGKQNSPIFNKLYMQTQHFHEFTFMYTRLQKLRRLRAER